MCIRDRLIDALRKLEQVAPERAVSMEQLQTVLAEDTVLHGAYYCPFPSFIDTYRAVGRMLERSGQSAYLMLCWLTDRQGQPLGDRERLVKATPQVLSLIHISPAKFCWPSIVPPMNDPQKNW